MIVTRQDVIRVFLLRHGRTEWNDAGRIQGHTDIELSEAGGAEVAAWAIPVEVSRFDWYSSPLSRATETARMLGADRELITDPRLKEMNWGDWEGRTRIELNRDLGEQMQAMEAQGMDLRPRRGESPRELTERFHAWLDDVAQRRRDVLAVTHKGVIRAALGLATGWDLTGRAPVRLQWDRGHVFRYRASDRRLSIDRVNVPLA